MSKQMVNLATGRRQSGIHARLTIGVILLLSLMLAGAALAAAVQVDDFNEGSLGSIRASASNPSVGATENTSSALGDERDIVAIHTSGAGSVSMEVNFEGSARLSFTAGSGVRGRGVVTWDGDDNDAFNNAQGLGGVDISDNNNNDGFHIEVLDNDFPARVIIRVYSSATEWSEGSFITPGGIVFPDHVDFFMPFSNFTQGTGASAEADFFYVTAIEFEIDGTLNSSTDLSLDFLDVDNFRDYGDLPVAFGGQTDASHFANGLRLGAQVDIEAAKPSTPGAGADTDDATEADDEDGVSRTPGVNWTTGAGGGRVNFTVNGCQSAPCYLNGWMDWDKNNSFDTGEEIFTNFPVSNGSYTNVPIMVPGTVSFNTSYYARFRICNNIYDCDDAAISDVTGGEVEDYSWSFGPTSVSLSSFGARVASPAPVNLLVYGLVGVLLAGLLVLRFSGRPVRE
jgi:hypothetical protein